jgi:hypothetical protein
LRYNGVIMKTFRMAVIGLALLTLKAGADEIQAPTQTIKLTTGKVVTTLQLPATLNKTPKPWLKVYGKEVVRDSKSVVIKGDATFDSSAGLKMTAEEITMNLNAEEAPTSFALSGKVVIQVQEEGKDVMRITADKAVMEPQ